MSENYIKLENQKCFNFVFNEYGQSVLFDDNNANLSKDKFPKNEVTIVFPTYVIVPDVENKTLTKTTQLNVFETNYKVVSKL